MSLADPPAKTMTAEELMALPDDGMYREIINGVLREWPAEGVATIPGMRPMTYRNRTHSLVEATTAALLKNWLDQCPPPRGSLHSGEVGFRLRRDPEVMVGIDVAIASAELLAATDPDAVFYDGAPALAVEILSPSDKNGDVARKVRMYLDAGSVVWVIDPEFRTLRVHRPGRVVELFDETQELSGDPELPGFRVRVADLFM